MGLFDDARDVLSKALSRASDALKGEEDITPERMRQALVNAGLAEPTDEKPRALFYDPYTVTDWAGWRERPSPLAYETLRQMSTANSIIAAVIQLRVDQVAQFARPQQSRFDRGFKIELRDRRDRKRVMTPAERQMATEIERMIETTGFLLPDEKPADRDSFRDFLKKSVRDILIYDQWAFERVRDRVGRVSRFHCLPAETIRPAAVDIEHMSAEERRDHISHVQVYENSVIAEFGPDDIAWNIKNPRSDLRANAFGFSPVEQCINLVTAWLFGFQHNQNHFANGALIPGIINIKGPIPDRQLKSFRRMWYSMVTGPQNSFRTPILNAEDLQWISMSTTNRDMEFSAWMDWLTKLTCAVFGVDPVEVNFQYGNTGQASSLNTPDNEKRVVESKDKGLRPLVDFIADRLNLHLIWEMNPDFEIVFSGLDAKSEEEERDALVKESGAFITVDEARARVDLDPLPDGQGKVILNTVWQQHAGGGDGGGGGAGGGAGAGAGGPGGAAGGKGGPPLGLHSGDDNEDGPGSDNDDSDGHDSDGDGKDEDDNPDQAVESLGKALRALVEGPERQALRKGAVRRRKRADGMLVIEIDRKE